MRSKALSWVVTLDGGTSTTRARLLHDGRVVATSRRAVGVRDAVRAPSDRLLVSAVRDVIRDVLADAGGVRPDAVVAAGMLSSEVGLATVPHVMAPAGPDELARHALLLDHPDVVESPILFVPGVRTRGGDGPDGWAEADVMRGEECETLGARRLLGTKGPLALLWPGSHTKLVETDDLGRIVRSTTTLAGEMTAALAGHTLIAASLPPTLPDDPDPEAVAAGARIVAEQGLGRAAFLVRVAALTGAMSPDQRAGFWVGAVVADDAAHLSRHAILSGSLPLVVGGRQPLRRLYAERIAASLGRPVAVLDEDRAEIASAVGALEVAQRHFAPRG